MDLGLKDRVVVVTGGASGIGEAISRACLDEGCQVVVVGRRTPDTIAFEEEMVAAHNRCSVFEAELGDPAQCRRAMEFVRQQHGTLHGLVNNAGTNDGIGLATGDPIRFEASLRQNLLHYYSMAHFGLDMLKAAQGSIVNVSSKVAVTGQGGTSAYAAAKGAQLALTREWAAELLPDGVRVNAVLPAEVLTPMYRRWIAEVGAADTLANIQRRIPLENRMTDATEIAAAVVFLLSPTKSGHTTAQHVFVDGGYTHLDRALTSRPTQT